MKQRILILCLFISSLFGYVPLFYSGLFIGQIEQIMLNDLVGPLPLSGKLSLYYPLNLYSCVELLPLIGQIFLLLAVLLSFTKMSGTYKRLSFVGVLIILIPFCLILYTGISEGNFKMIASTIPLFSFAGLLLWSFKKKK
jgi:hypothetical protein